MQPYSPPLTRQRARALYLVRAEQQERREKCRPRPAEASRLHEEAAPLSSNSIDTRGNSSTNRREQTRLDGDSSPPVPIAIVGNVTGRCRRGRRDAVKTMGDDTSVPCMSAAVISCPLEEVKPSVLNAEHQDGDSHAPDVGTAEHAQTAEPMDTTIDRDRVASLPNGKVKGEDEVHRAVPPAPPICTAESDREGGREGGKIHTACSGTGFVTGAESPADADAGNGGGKSKGKTEIEASRLKGKSVETAGSTGVSPMQKRNRRELKLSEEETAMAGAPQGPVYQVTVLETAELEPSANPSDEMHAVIVAANGGGDWADQYGAVDSARRLSIHHKDLILRDNHLESAIDVVVAAVGNLRSSMVRNALLCVRDMFSYLGESMRDVNFERLIAGTLQRSAGDKRFICQTAAQALEAAAKKGPGKEVLHAILSSFEDRNAEIVAKATLYVERCLAALGVGREAGGGLPEGLDVKRLLGSMGKVVKGKVAEGRTASRRGLLRCRNAMGSPAFETALCECLDKAEVSDILSALSTGSDTRGHKQASEHVRAERRGDAAKLQVKRGGRPAGQSSIREQMLSARRQREAERRAVAEDQGCDREKAGDSRTNRGSDFVVVT